MNNLNDIKENVENFIRYEIKKEMIANEIYRDRIIKSIESIKIEIEDKKKKINCRVNDNSNDYIINNAIDIGYLMAMENAMMIVQQSINEPKKNIASTHVE